jgi:glutamate/tyrosine decarboxylase-like PLP-dependent enzyme
VDQEAELERMAPTSLNIVCFRYRGANGKPLDDKTLDHLNEQIVVSLQMDGVAMPSATVLKGRYAIRMCNVNHRSRREDFDLLLHEVLKRGRVLAAAHAQEAR